MLNFEIFEGSDWGVSAFVRYSSGFHFQEIDHNGYGEILTPANVRNVVKQIIDHVNESEDMITPFDMNEPTTVKQYRDEVFLEWRGGLNGLNDRGMADTIILSVEVGHIPPYV